MCIIIPSRLPNIERVQAIDRVDHICMPGRASFVECEFEIALYTTKQFAYVKNEFLFGSFHSQYFIIFYKKMC